MSQDDGWKLDDIARAMGLGTKQLDGAKEAELVKAGRLIEVADSALADVRLLRRILARAKATGGVIRGATSTARLPAGALDLFPVNGVC